MTDIYFHRSDSGVFELEVEHVDDEVSITVCSEWNCLSHWLSHEDAEELYEALGAALK